MMRTTNIKGKAYVEVKERLKYFRANFPEYSLISGIIERTDKEVVMYAKVLNPKGIIVATGTAHEVAGSSNINKVSHIDNWEASAWGRARGYFGIGIVESVASADELLNKEIIESSKDKITSEQIEKAHKYMENEEVKKMIVSRYGSIEEMPSVKWSGFVKWAEGICTK